MSSSLVEELGEATFFRRPQGQVGYAIVVVRRTGASGSEPHLVLRAGERLEEGWLNRLVDRYQVYRVNTKAQRDPLDIPVHPSDWDRTLVAHINLHYQVEDPSKVALEVEDPVGSLFSAVIAHVNRSVEATPHEKVTASQISSAIGKLGDVDGIRILRADVVVDRDPGAISEIAAERSDLAAERRAERLGIHPLFLEQPELARDVLHAQNERVLQQLVDDGKTSRSEINAVRAIMVEYVKRGGDPDDSTAVRRLLGGPTRVTDEGLRPELPRVRLGRPPTADIHEDDVIERPRVRLAPPRSGSRDGDVIEGEAKELPPDPHRIHVRRRP